RRRARTVGLTETWTERGVDTVAVLAHLLDVIATDRCGRVDARRGRKAKPSDSGLPEAAARNILVRVPEGTIVDRVHVHRAVVAPALGEGLRAGAADDGGL